MLQHMTKITQQDLSPANNKREVFISTIIIMIPLLMQDLQFPTLQRKNKKFSLKVNLVFTLTDLLPYCYYIFLGIESNQKHFYSSSVVFLLTMCLRSAGSFWISSNSLIFSGSKSSCSSHVASSYERLHHLTR